MSYGNIYFLYKEAGDTSFQAINKLKKAYNLNKVGHCGTLDKFAEGLLIVLSGHATKLAGAITGLAKSYVADVEFGRETTTLDPEGQTCRKAKIPEEQRIREVLHNWLEKIQQDNGLLRQVPPAFSAIHSGGKRLYQRALAGEDLSDLAEREVALYSCEIIEWQAPVLRLRLHCSKGFYVRSFARDLGQLCNSAAHLRSLLRTSIGSVTLEQAQRLEEGPEPRALVDLLLRLRCELSIDVWCTGENGLYPEPEYPGGTMPQQEFLELRQGRIAMGIYRHACQIYRNLTASDKPQEFAVLQQEKLLGLFRYQTQTDGEGKALASIKFWHNFSNI